MPLILAGIAAGALGILGFKVFSDEAQDTAQNTLPLLVVSGVAGFLIWQQFRKAK